jgi:23S rRNA (adenine2503-C2)-methyltransferase
MGFTRNLSSGEIVEQVIWFNRWLRDHPHAPASQRGHRYTGSAPTERERSLSRPSTFPVPRTDSDSWFGGYEGRERVDPIRGVTNVVFMGMGEPLLNYKHLWEAIRVLNSPQGLGLGARRLTVSTVGIVPGIRRFAREDISVNLAVSLHAPNDELRGSFMPINVRYPVADLLEACRDYVNATRRRITFEYVLIKGTNDSLEYAAQLRDLLRGLLCHVNLIPLNPVPGSGMEATTREQVYAFQKVLEDAGIRTTVRIERGADIAAACGQLKVDEEPGSRHRTLNPELVRAHVQADLAANDPAFDES